MAFSNSLEGQLVSFCVRIAATRYRYVALLREVSERTGRMIAGWQAVGFGERLADCRSVPAPPSRAGARKPLAALIFRPCSAVHGVMNTDNMSILGLTIDYGEYRALRPSGMPATARPRIGRHAES